MSKTKSTAKRAKTQVASKFKVTISPKHPRPAPFDDFTTPMKAELLEFALEGMHQVGKYCELADRQWQGVQLLAQDIAFDLLDDEKTRDTQAAEGGAR